MSILKNTLETTAHLEPRREHAIALLAPFPPKPILNELPIRVSPIIGIRST